MSKNNHYWNMQYLLLSFLMASIFIPNFSVKADAGPSPSMSFIFQFPSDNFSITEGKLLNCSDQDCKIFKTYDGYFDCNATSCLARPQGAPEFDYYKIVITFNNGVRESNVFEKKSFYSEYLVTVDEDRLIVKENFTLSSLFNPFYLIFFILSAILTIPAETAIALIYFLIIKINKSFLLMVVLANLFSLATIWFIFPIFLETDTFFIIIAEIFVVIFETAFLFFTGRKFRFLLLHAGILSIIMNLASFSLGWWLLS